MGLDIYFHKTNRKDWKNFQNNLKAYDSLPESEKNEDNNPYNGFDPEEIGYFRKVNFLMNFFSYTGNCEYKEITKDKLLELLDACKEISRMKPVRYEVMSYANGGEEKCEMYSETDKKRCAELLPTTSGFFFGSTDYDQWYFQDVKEVRMWVDDVLDKLENNEVVLMCCWW